MRNGSGFSTKVHASVDALGNLLRFILTAGQEHAVTQAGALIDDMDCERVVRIKDMIRMRSGSMWRRAKRWL